MFDIARVICGFCDPDVRRELELTVVESYFELLRGEMKKQGRALCFGLEVVSMLLQKETQLRVVSSRL